MAMDQGSEFLRYLAANGCPPGQRLPPIQELAADLGLSVGKLREQLEVARQMGLVEVRPKTGMRALGYSFFPSLWMSLRFALALNPGDFEYFEALRNHVEASFFPEAVRLLKPEDIRHLNELIESAWRRLRGEPIQIPHAEHRDLHLTVYTRLANPFVRGILEAYWTAYETVGYNLYADYRFLHEVWTYHQAMVEAINRGDYERAHAAFVEHTSLLHKRPRLARSRPSAVAAGSPTNAEDTGRRVIS
jgi:DNA-binding FadR family transcriptional regulator